MADILDLDAEFSAQMRDLVQEAAQAVEERAAATPRPDGMPETAKQAQARAVKDIQTLPEVLRPLVAGLQAVGRATDENTQLLTKLGKSLAQPGPVPSEGGDPKVLPQLVTELQGMIEQRNSVSRQMFNALHEELRSYKDGFLLDSVHRPMIRDLISLYDDLTEIHRQMQAAVAEQERSSDGVAGAILVLERLRGIETHIDHNRDFIMEVLARLEVTKLPHGTGKLDKLTQRVVAVEMAEDPDQDGDIVKSLKRGFLWKERVVRPEEVVIKKWKEGFLIALHTPQI